MRGSLSTFILAAAMAATLLLSGTDACARKLRVGIGFAIPPYVISQEDAGLEVDVIRSAMRAAGLEAQFVYLPNLRLPLAYAEEEVDCLAITLGYELEGQTGRKTWYSGSTVTFQNYAVSLADRGLHVDSIPDLTKYDVLGFQDADNYLGPDFAAMTAGNARYKELSDQALQVRMLFSGRVDVIISEGRVFHYWLNRLKSSTVAKSVNLNQDVAFSRLFPAQPRGVAFADKHLRDRFNEGLAAIRANGTYDGILLRYDRLEYHPGN